MKTPHTDSDRRYWLDDPKNVHKLIALLTILCGIAFLGSFLYHSHSNFSLESIFGFHGIFGFVACVILVLVAKWMRTFLMRPEEYYGDDNDD